MYLIDPHKTFKFGIMKGDKKTPYIPVKVEDEAQIKEGQIIFEAKAYSTKDVVRWNELKGDWEKLEFIKARTSCNKSMDNMIPSILFVVNAWIMGLSIMSEEDETLFM